MATSDDGDTIAGRWEVAPDGRRRETDFDLTYRKASSAGITLGVAGSKIMR